MWEIWGVGTWSLILIVHTDEEIRAALRAMIKQTPLVLERAGSWGIPCEFAFAIITGVRQYAGGASAQVNYLIFKEEHIV
jgi:hypothetical protein